MKKLLLAGCILAIIGSACGTRTEAQEVPEAQMPEETPVDSVVEVNDTSLYLTDATIDGVQMETMSPA